AHDATDGLTGGPVEQLAAEDHPLLDLDVGADRLPAGRVLGLEHHLEVPRAGGKGKVARLLAEPLEAEAALLDGAAAAPLAVDVPAGGRLACSPDLHGPAQVLPRSDEHVEGRAAEVPLVGLQPGPGDDREHLELQALPLNAQEDLPLPAEAIEPE